MSELVEKKKGNGGFVAVIILLIGVIGFMAYSLSTKGSELDKAQNQNKRLNADMNGMNQMMSGYLGDMTNDMKSDFSAILETIDELKVNSALDKDSLEAQQYRMEELQEQVSRGKMNGYQLFKARKEIETMKSIMRGYIVQIDSLSTLNLSLTNDLDETRLNLDNTKEERDQYKEDAAQSAEKVKVGSKLQAYNFSSGGLKMKVNNTTTDSDRARNTVQIKSSFTISENLIATSGKKTVYLQIVSPDGKILQSSSGNVVSTENGPIAYSDYKDIDYTNQRLDMAIYYRLNNQKATKGNYKVKVYCQGQLIGTDSFTLK